jgi:hypothetical protein
VVPGDASSLVQRASDSPGQKYERGPKRDQVGSRRHCVIIRWIAGSSDKPLERAGRKLGLRVPEPDLEDGESIRWEDRANRFKSKSGRSGVGFFSPTVD